LFLAVAVLGITAKYLYVLISSASAGSVIGRELMKGASDIDARAFAEQLLKGLPAPGRFFVRRSFKKAVAGSLLGAPRFFFGLTQLQGALTLAQTVCVVWAIYTVSHHATFGTWWSRGSHFGF
jgi:hypothetical protein